MTIRLLAIPAFLLISGGMFVSWHITQGFIAWDPAWWVWLGDTILWYRMIPTDMLFATATAIVLFLLVTIALITFDRRIGGRTLFGDRDASSLHGSARWAMIHDVKAAGLISKTGVTVGAFGKKVLRHDGPEHIMAFAPTRSGKGVGLVLPTLLEWKESVVILDIKGENHAITSPWRASIGQKVLKFEPTAPEGSASFNPLAEIRKGTDYELQDCQNIAAMVIDPDGKGLNDFWKQSGFEWLTAGILHVLYRVQREDGRTANLADVNQIMAGARVDDDAEDVMEAILDEMIAFDHGRETVNIEVRRCAKAMKAIAPPQRSGTHSTSMAQLALYADPIVTRNTSKSDFSIDDLMNDDTPVSLYIVIPPSDIDRLRPLVRIIFNIMLRRLTSDMEFADGRSVAGYKHRLLLMLDEFTSIGKLEIFEKALAFMAGYGLKCYLIVQDLTQLQQAYGKEESITSNCHIRIAYAPNKVETAKILSDYAGKTTIVQKKRSKSGGGGKGGGSISDSVSETGVPLLTPDECMSLPGAQKNAAGEVTKPGAMLIFAAGFAPIYGQQRLYFMDETLMARAKSAPSDGASEPVKATPASSYTTKLTAMAASPIAADVKHVKEEGARI